MSHAHSQRNTVLYVIWEAEMPNCSQQQPRKVAKKHVTSKQVTFRVTSVMLIFPQLENFSLISIDVGAHNWAECVTVSFSEGCWKTVWKSVIQVGADRAGWEKVEWEKRNAMSERTEHYRFFFLILDFLSIFIVQNSRHVVDGKSWISLKRSSELDSV